MRVMLITPPMTQINSPYPATAYLKAHLKSLGHEVHQADLGLELILSLFSRQGLAEIRDVCLKSKARAHDSVAFFLEAFDDYQSTIEPVINFLQGKDPSLAIRIAKRMLLPEGPRFLPLAENSESLLSPFGEMGVQDLAKYRASLYLDDLADVLTAAVDPRFEFSRYGESLASSQNSFTPLHKSLSLETLIDRHLIALFQKHLQAFPCEVVGFSVPFPGNVYAALRLGKFLGETYPQIRRVMGGGFVNTELRELSDPRFFDHMDFLTFDDGERPLQRLLEHFEGKNSAADLPRVKYRRDALVISQMAEPPRDLQFKDLVAPDYSGLPFDRYVAMLELPNPMFRLWSDFRWNKMILAHGCYWKKCTFCDVNLDYIGRYEPQKVHKLVDFMEELQQQTGSSGFHFVDEAAPPALLKSLSEEIIRRKMKVSWWGNLRFDSYFTAEVAALMADAGCIAVTGGLEVASPRLLKLINKGVTIEQVAQVTKNFKAAGIFVHAYLMYGFPTQTAVETMESLAVVRDLFREGALDSAHWHRFLCTVHSPIGRQPDEFHVELQTPGTPREGLFARYSVPFTDGLQVNHDDLGRGLRDAVYNFMHGSGLEVPIQDWFKV